MPGEGLAQAMLALRGEIEFVDDQVLRLETLRARLVVALDALEGIDGPLPMGRRSGVPLIPVQPAPRPAAAAVAVFGCGDCEQAFRSKAGLGSHRFRRHGIRKDRPAEGVGTVGAGNPEGPAGVTAGGPPTVTATPTPTEADGLAAVVALLDRPGWIDGAVEKGNGSWVRADGEPWGCSCGRKVASIARMRDHLRSVVNPDAHRPEITAGSDIAGRNFTTDVAAPPPAPIGSVPSSEATKPVVRENGMVDGLPFGCACSSRFPTARDWSDHVKTAPQKDRKRHRLVDQPKSVMVDTGVAHPKPHIAPLKPGVAALQDNVKAVSHRNDFALGSVI